MSHRIFRLFLSLIILVGLAAMQAPPVVRAAGPWYVATTGNDGNDCLSPGTACGTINGAIGKASAGEIVKVMVGTYTDIGAEVVFIIQDITLSGGWDATFTNQNGMSAIDGQGSRRGITLNNIGPVVIENFVIQNGFSGIGGGGGIFNNGGTITINNTVIKGNSAGDPCCTGGSGGGGIANGGTVFLNNSTVSGNTILGGFYGSGILNYGTITINNSSVSGNTAGDGIYNGALQTMILNNSTVSGNPSGGVFNNVGTLTFQNSTISDNAFGIYNNGGTVTIQNSILAGNMSAGIPNDCIFTLESAGYNLIGNTSGCSFTPVTGDLTNIEPKLGPLVEPAGLPGYHSLLPGSPAIDAGNPAGCTDQNGNLLTTDQRGVARPQGLRCDIGAFELEAENPVIEVPIDIIPGSTTNIINLRSAGTVPVAILSTATFNAPALVNKSSLTFGKTGNEASLSHCLTKQLPDVNGDGRPDLLCYFRIGLTGLAPGNPQAILRGLTMSGTAFEGVDLVKVSGSKNP